jgi:hypothetical protein
MTSGVLPSDLCLRLHGDAHLAVDRELVPEALPPVVRPLLLPGHAYGLKAGGRPVTQDQLDAWGVTFEQAADAAAAGYITPAPTWSGGLAVIRDPQFAVLVWLDPERARAWRDPPPRKLFGKKRPVIPDPPVVLTPTADTTLIGPAAPATYRAALEHVARLLGEGAPGVSMTPYRYDVTQWTRFDPVAAPDLEALREEVSAEFRAALYEYQKPLLRARLAVDGEDAHVAGTQVLRSPAGEVVSAAAWAEGVATLLPETDLVRLVPAGRRGRDEEVVTTWARLDDLAPGWSLATGLTPERHRTIAFPNASLRERLRQDPGERVRRKDSAERALPGVFAANLS